MNGTIKFITNSAFLYIVAFANSFIL